jgi:hypothetical protein
MFSFGPLAPEFDYPNSPRGVQFDKPCEFAGSILADVNSPFGVVTKSNGERYFEATFKASGTFKSQDVVLILL